MIVSAIVAKDENNLIGIGLKMPWHLPTDFSYFYKTTLHHPIIFGRKSFESIGCKPLPKRHHIIVSRDPKLSYPNVDCVTTLEDAIALAKTFGNEECFICGGGQIYKYALENKLIDKLYITEVHTKIKVDEEDKAVYFPNYGNDNWDMTSVKAVDADELNKYNMTFLQFERNF